MLDKLVRSMVLVVTLTAATVASSAPPAGAARHMAATCGGRVGRTEQAAAPAGARRPVAMVPGSTYDPRTMTPRGICRAAPGGWAI
ncbi:MAG TPA: hypothetical protein VH620_10770 [Gaiella sp.]|jgi:hypothetical protein